jgi:putative transcriptional regulator
MPVDLPGNLRRLRASAGLTQKELAEKAGIHVLQISRYENGHERPGLDYLEKLAGGLGCTVADLVAEGPDPLAPEVNGYDNQRAA